MSYMSNSKDVDLQKAEPVVIHPIVLRFEKLGLNDLGGFNMHDRRNGGDLSHVDLSKTKLNRIEHGSSGWAKKFEKRIARIQRRNFKRALNALIAKGRHKEAARFARKGLQRPWNGNTDKPLREGILSVNKSWFGGSGCATWDDHVVENFRTHAMDFLRQSFPGSQLLFATSHSDEEAFHIHFVVGVWDVKTTRNRGQQYLLRAAANPLLNNYELAQDLAGAHFEQIGLRRGDRLAEARRIAGKAGEEVPAKRRHVSPSEYRAREVNKGQMEADGIIETAKEDASMAVRKSRSRRSKRMRNSKRAEARAVERAKKFNVQVEEQSRKLTDQRRELSETENAKLVSEYELDQVTAQALDVVDATKDHVEGLLRSARKSGEKIIRKSRKRAIREAAERKAKLDAETEASRAVAEAQLAGTLERTRAEVSAAECAKFECLEEEVRAKQAKIETDKQMELTRNAIKIMEDASNRAGELREEAVILEQDREETARLRAEAKINYAESKAEREKAANDRDQMMTDYDALQSVLSEFANGSLKHNMDTLEMIDPEPLRAASRKVRTVLVSIAKQLVLERDRLEALKRTYEVGIARIKKWLKRDDLPRTARIEARDIVNDLNRPG